MRIPKPLQDFLDKHKIPPGDLWDCHGTPVIKHKRLEVVAAKEGIVFDAPEWLHTTDTHAACCVTGRLRMENGEALVHWSSGEAGPKNCKSPYPYAMAEKRAQDRVILKLLKIHGFVYSEMEADDFQQPKGSRSLPAGVERGPSKAQQNRDRMAFLEAQIEDCQSISELEAFINLHGREIDGLYHNAAGRIYNLADAKDRALRAEMANVA